MVCGRISSVLRVVSGLKSSTINTLVEGVAGGRPIRGRSLHDSKDGVLEAANPKRSGVLGQSWWRK